MNKYCETCKCNISEKYYTRHIKTSKHQKNIFFESPKTKHIILMDRKDDKLEYEIISLTSDSDIDEINLKNNYSSN